MRSLLLMLCVVSCAAPKVGEKCNAGDAWCADKDTSVYCKDGIVAEAGCPGPKGCSVDAKRMVMCDQSAGATAGDFCFSEYDGKAQCATDGHDRLICRGNKWVISLCEDGTTCRIEVGGVSCQ